MRLRLASLRIKPWGSLVILALLAMGANQVGIELFYGAHLHLGSAAFVLALLLFGDAGLLVGAASILLVPRLWHQPQACIVLLTELLWLKLFLELGADPVRRRESGWIILADILFWFLIAIPLDFLVFALGANDDIGSVLDLSLLQGINGAINATLGFLVYVLIRMVQARRDAGRSVSLHGLLLSVVMAVTLTASVLSLSFSTRQLNQQFSIGQLQRFRQAAVISASLEASALDGLATTRRRALTGQDFRVFDRSGQLIYSSNPILFTTLEQSYSIPLRPTAALPALPRPLQLLVPLDGSNLDDQPLRGYWRYNSDLDRDGRPWQGSEEPLDRLVQLVEPARAGVEMLQAQNTRSIRFLGLIVILTALTAEAIAQLVLRQIPDPRLLPACADPRGAVPETETAAAPPISEAELIQLASRSQIRELHPLLLSLQRQADTLHGIREALGRSEHKRRHLQTEVDRLNILDPLTGCYNRRELYRRLDHELRLSEREDRELSFLCLEIDHLRRIKDSYGSFVADEILRRVAMELRNRSRATDFLCRMGPDQFGLLLTACDADSAGRVGEFLGESIRALEIRHETSLLAVTMSVGVAALRPGRDDPDALITRAQSALYRAKAEGRNRVVIA